MSYKIFPDAPGHPATAFKVTSDKVKVATLTREQVTAALKDHQDEREKAIHREIQGIISDLENSADGDGTLDGQEALRSLNELDRRLRTGENI